MKTYVLFVSGGDYASVLFDDAYSNIDARIAKTMIINRIKKATLRDEKGNTFELALHKFGPVDERFIRFVRDEIQTSYKHESFTYWTGEQMKSVRSFKKKDMANSSYPLKEFILTCLRIEESESD